MELITERLILREFRADDWPAVLDYQRDPRYLRFYEWTDRTPEAAQEFVHMFLGYQRETPRRKFQLVVALKANGQLIGNCGVRLPAIDAHEGEIGYELAPDHWGHGYATEAARAMVDFAFGSFGLHRLAAWCIADNAGSARVLQKLGMQLEGRLREKEYFKGRWWDSLVFGLLRREWEQAH